MAAGDALLTPIQIYIKQNLNIFQKNLKLKIKKIKQISTFPGARASKMERKPVRKVT